MPIATGVLSGTFNNFEGHWNVDDFGVSLRGNFSPSVGRWESAAVTLEYNNVQDFVGTFVVDTAGPPSYIGPIDASITLVNQGGKRIKITGPLQVPLPQRTAITGQGAWAIMTS
ncbi:hypothetical protein BDV26DRAFT_293678 [Aspergillus bertholletiae]|uniref:Uncharacterized protein n=1 Tax=Aspergillus bertholletiae TaxID=1226010 RepID=A0A5N7B448_9EURO|nr:hypothetical protein BDV26DRAFT_293678 [Aspergillus bertholletiae]